MNMKLEPLLPKKNNNHAEETDISGTIFLITKHHNFNISMSIDEAESILKAKE